jgi:hypothetical protein
VNRVPPVENSGDRQPQVKAPVTRPLPSMSVPGQEPVSMVCSVTIAKASPAEDPHWQVKTPVIVPWP